MCEAGYVIDGNFPTVTPLYYSWTVQETKMYILYIHFIPYVLYYIYYIHIFYTIFYIYLVTKVSIM